MRYSVMESVSNLTIGERISILRKRSGLTRREFARLLNVSYTTVANYENNKSIPNIRRVSEMSVILSTTMNMILHGYEPEKEDFII